MDRLEIWDRLADPLAERGQVARIDQRGHGESDAPPGPYRRSDLARDVASVIGVLGGHRTVLVGHSMGGIISPKLSAITCPVLLIVGANDPMGPKASSIIADQLPDAQLEVVPECGH